jgi:hypothetical protein
MKYFLDTEFNGFGGELLSLALVREDNEAIYITYKYDGAIVEWVRNNVMPIMLSIPSPMPGMAYIDIERREGAAIIRNFLNQDPQKLPVIVADWPDDIAYLCKALMTGPGMMAAVDRIVFDYVSVDAWFEGKFVKGNTPEGAVQHNAYWDAQALRMAFQ